MSNVFNIVCAMGAGLVLDAFLMVKKDFGVGMTPSHSPLLQRALRSIKSEDLGTM